MAAEYLLPLADDEKTALTALLKRTIDADHYPLSPRIRVLRGILARLEPPKPAPAPQPPLQVYEPPRARAVPRLWGREASPAPGIKRHVWTTPSKQGRFGMLRRGRERSCVRPT